MATSYTALLGLALPVTGELQGTWGDTVNNSITQLCEDSIAGVATQSVLSADWTLTTTGSGAANQARMAILIPTGAPGVSRNIIAPAKSKIYTVINQSNANVVIKGAATTGVTIAAGDKVTVVWNGSDFVNIVTTGAAGTFTNLTYTGTLTGSTGIMNIGSGQLYKDASGNVGIGTASPFSSAGYTVLNINNATNGGLLMLTNGTQTYWNYVNSAGGWLGTSSAHPLIFQTSNAERMRIDSSGNVGIGVSSMASTLHVSASASLPGTPIIGDSAAATLTSIASRNSNASGIPGISLNSNLAWTVGKSTGQIRFDGLTTLSTYTVFSSIYSTSGTNTTTGAPTSLLFNTSDGTASAAERMRIDSAGNVGIGATTPSDALQIQRTATAVDTCIRYWNTLNAWRTGMFASIDAYVISDVSRGERMRIDSSGNVGVGTSSPTTYGKLAVQGTSGSNTASFLSGSAGSFGAISIGRTANEFSLATVAAANNFFSGTSSGDSVIGYGTGKLFIGGGNTGVGGTLAAVFDSAGNVGIGTTSPAVTVDVFSPSNTFGTIRIGDYRTAGAGSTIPIMETFGCRGDGNSTFYGRFGASKRMYTGTAIPSGQAIGAYAFGAQWGTDLVYNSANLLYAASITGVSESSFTSATTMSTAITFNTGSTGSVLSNPNVSYGTERMRIDSTGNVGIGTSSPLRKLQVAGQGFIQDATNPSLYLGNTLADYNSIRYDPVSKIGYVQADGAGTQLVFGTANLERMRIDASGNVAIGATSAAVKLVVSSTDSILLPKGTTAQRPTGVSGYVRFNTDLGQFEGYNGTAWGTIGGGATGGGSNQVFYENGQTVSVNYTITSGKSAMSTGPITINSGIVVTIPSGSRWVVL